MDDKVIPILHFAMCFPKGQTTRNTVTWKEIHAPYLLQINICGPRKSLWKKVKRQSKRS